MQLFGWLIFLGCAIFSTEGSVNACIPLNVKTQNEIDVDGLITEMKQDIMRKINENINDSIPVGEIPLDFTHEAISIYGTLNNTLMYNLFNYSLSILDIDTVKGKFDIFNLTFHELKLSGDYDITGNIGELFDIFGTGPFWLNLTDFSIGMTDFNVCLNYTTASTDLCLTINIDLDLQQTKCELVNFMGDQEVGDLVNKAIYTLLPDIVRILWSEFKSNVDPWIQDTINDFLQHKNFATVLSELVKNPKSRPLFAICLLNKN